MPKQTGDADCGLYSMAIATTLLRTWNQDCKIQFLRFDYTLKT